MADKFLIIGLGSMGKRRVRNLQALGFKEVVGFDLREDRRQETEEKYGIPTISSLEGLDTERFDAFIVSTPPHLHNPCIQYALEKRKPVFVEASVILEGLEELNARAKEIGVLIVPSCTMRFHPAIKDITRIVRSGTYGKVTNFTYHCGQYLPDWHPWEKVGDYYAGRKDTGGAREIVPFELTWLTDVVGFPKIVKACVGKTIDVGADIDDTYAVVFDCGECYGTMVVDVVARYGTRSLLLNMEKGQMIWRWDEPQIKVYDATTKQWTTQEYTQGTAQTGYNRNIAEEMYIDEMQAFIHAVEGKAAFPNTLDEDVKILKLLHQIEDTAV